eukprot:TRINITY_DN93_c0_g2_i1.p1 TRINITY_DN93_c0_g2~~TRINITY_DN93_c0_g2_i1.p1  ORF type:complete len:333 (-),score=47.58 TRINITY_DN93_c0_g2_i1:199-1197(-)
MAAAQHRQELDVLVESLVATANKAHEAGVGNQVYVNSFCQGYSKTIKLLEEIDPAQDPAPQLALKLMLAMLSKQSSAVWEKSLPHRGDVCSRHSAPLPCILAKLPTPSRSTVCFPGTRLMEVRDLRGNAVGWTIPGTQAQEFNACIDSQSSPCQHSAHTVHLGLPTGSEGYFESNAAGWNSMAQDVHYQDYSPCPRSPRKRSVTVINPRTGEKLVISSVAPFSWRHSNRLRIFNPKTGEEILPDNILGKGQSRQRNSEQAGRLSTGSVPTSARQRRQSVAGGAIKEGSCWALEPASGGYWDWPLSRQEKKDRVLLLSQLELLSQIDELQARP